MINKKGRIWESWLVREKEKINGEERRKGKGTWHRNGRTGTSTKGNRVEEWNRNENTSTSTNASIKNEIEIETQIQV